VTCICILYLHIISVPNICIWSLYIYAIYLRHAFMTCVCFICLYHVFMVSSLYLYLICVCDILWCGDMCMAGGRSWRRTRGWRWIGKSTGERHQSMCSPCHNLCECESRRSWLSISTAIPCRRSERSRWQMHCARREKRRRFTTTPSCWLGANWHEQRGHS
jgi:hypothetical protein